MLKKLQFSIYFSLSYKLLKQNTDPEKKPPLTEY
jgi:hypothetical protein